MHIKLWSENLKGSNYLEDNKLNHKYIAWRYFESLQAPEKKRRR